MEARPAGEARPGGEARQGGGEDVGPAGEGPSVAAGEARPGGVCCGTFGCTLLDRHSGLCQIAPVPRKRPRASVPKRYEVPLLQEQEKLRITKAKGMAFGSTAPKSAHEERTMLAHAMALSTSAAEARGEIVAVERGGTSASDAAAAALRGWPRLIQPDGSLPPAYVGRKLWRGAAVRRKPPSYSSPSPSILPCVLSTVLYS